jgi:ribosome biogenesis GTPase
VGGHAWTPALSRRIGYAGLDEDDVRVRPGKGSRPRTRRRPAHSDATEAFVAAVDRGRYRCFVGDLAVTAMGARELGHRRVVVGDQVRLAGDISGAPGALARVVGVLPRTSVLRRSADDSDPVERVIVANAEQLVIVCALADPPPRTRLIDRFLVAAYDAGLDLKNELVLLEPLQEFHGNVEVFFEREVTTVKHVAVEEICLACRPAPSPERARSPRLL